MPAELVKVKDFRAHLKEYLDGAAPIVVTRGRKKVAVILPTGLPRWADDEALKKSRRRMEIMLRDDVPAALARY